ncbi:NB-ARC domain-containing protein [Streptomyces sp. NPDC057620]|uniref:NB-ARC domain-containing protein n=1 Tax=Streptomyces sp. NPDC057620 TaxID=3346185 RepID=UPI0036923E3B
MRTSVLVLLAAVCGGLGVLIGLAGNAATGQSKWPGPLDWLRAEPWSWLYGLGALAALFAALAVWVDRRPDTGARNDPDPPPPPVVPDYFEPRQQSREVITAVCADRREVGITTSLWGAGGFGKTMLAKYVAAQRPVQRHFRQRVYVVTVGRDVRSRTEIAEKVAEVVAFITGDTNTPVSDPEAAGAHLGRLLDARPRTLLLLDDVWEQRQLDPFLVGGPRCVRLITTRNGELLSAEARRIHVDQMTPEQARRVLTRGLPQLARSLGEDLMQVTGRWALLLRLANRLIARHVDAGTDARAAAEALLERLRERGPAAVDGPTSTWDLDDRDLRNRAVEASIEASAALLSAEAVERFIELGIFAPDEPIPITFAAMLWEATGGLTIDQSRLLSLELARLSLISFLPAEGRIGLHDVIREYLRARTDPSHLAHLNEVFVEAAAATVPSVAPLAGATPGPVRAWWQSLDGYLHDHLIGHLLATGQPSRAEAVAGDVRWVEMRLHQRGPNAPWSDLIRIGTPRSLALAQPLAQNAHFLTPTEPAPALTGILHARLAQSVHWRPQITARQAGPDVRPCLAPRWSLPDTPHPARLRTFRTAIGGVFSVAWSADGRLAAGGHRGVVRVWDATAGTWADLSRHVGRVSALEWSADGRLAVGSDDAETVLVWDMSADTSIELPGHAGGVYSVAWSTDGRVAAGGRHGVVRVWDVAARTFVDLERPVAGVFSMAWSADGRLAVGADDGVVRVWDIATGTWIDVHGYAEAVFSVAWSPDGHLTAGGRHGVVRVWDMAPGAGPGDTRDLSSEVDEVFTVAWSTDGRLAAGGGTGAVRVWDPAAETWSDLPGHTSAVYSVAWSPDGRLATSDIDAVVRVWDAAAGVSAVATSSRGGETFSVAWSADGQLAAGGRGGVVRVWDASTGTLADPPDRFGEIGMSAVAWSADGRLAAGGRRGVVRVWDTGAGTFHDLMLPDYGNPVLSMAWSADGYLAAGGRYGVLRIWDVPARTWVDLPSHASTVSSLAWSAEGRLAATGDDGIVRIWDVPARTRMDLPGHASAVSSVAWSPEGLLAAAIDDGIVRVWDAAAGTWIDLPRHSDDERWVAWSADSYLATGDRSGVVRVWDVTALRVLTLLRTEDVLHACAWSPDGRGLAIGGNRGLYVLDFLT